MRIGWAILGVTLGLSAAARAEDMKTLAGQTYSNVVVQRFDGQGYYIRHDGGTNAVPFADISPELRGHYKALSLSPISASRLSGEKEAPAGPNDLVTVSGQIYRNVVLKKIEADSILIAHDTGMDTVSFSAIPRSLHETYRTGTRVVPDPAPGDADLVSAYGQIFRNVEIIREEPDGLTFRHDGGVTKLGFPALKEELRQRYDYDPIAGWQYRRDQAAQKLQSQQAAEPESQGPALVEISNLQTEALPDDLFKISFALKNLTDQAHSAAATLRDKDRTALISRTLELAPHAATKLLQIEVPGIRPHNLLIVSGTYRTNCVLNW
ncbi:MAG: hypothetical protein AB7V14_10850 [Kiritimatiellia bacterium]